MSEQYDVAFIGNSLPRRCGIATFTTDLHHAVAQSGRGVGACIVAMNDSGRTYDYPDSVRLQIGDHNQAEYRHAADELNAGGIGVVSLQHEFGIFGGEAGADILQLLSRLTMPVVTTLHTVLAQPSATQRSVLGAIIERSAKLILMAEKGRDLLRTIYQVPEEKLEVIPHGIPDVPFVGSEHAKRAFGFSGRPVILTFGLLSPNKGIETMIDAMPAVLARRPNAVYVVLGATHPNLLREKGESYREGLAGRARALGIAEHVVFMDQFVDQGTLLQFISMCDVYVTPYLNEEQMTSGTLAYSFGLGRAVVSTPYWHARELLADGRGILVPFADSNVLGKETAALLSDDVRRLALGKRAYVNSRSMIWPRVAERYLAAFEEARRACQRRSPKQTNVEVAGGGIPRLPSMELGHFLGMCDDTGLFQHAVHSVPDRSHGYCIDDNARALLLSCALSTSGEQRLPDVLTGRFASFIQHAWNPEVRRFRNFLGFDRRWLEEQGSEDSHGRALWALGECALKDVSPARRRWAAGLFAQALPSTEAFHSPRAWSFTLLGLDGYCRACSDDHGARRLRKVLADRLVAMMSSTESEDWQWFEDGLAYDNARLPQSLIVTAHTTGTAAYKAAGLRALRWLIGMQSTLEGVFRPIGSLSFGSKRVTPQSFDQQPLEATATIAACLAAGRADGDPNWRTEAQRAFAWFFGANELSLPLVDTKTGSCCDGLHPDRVNENCGGESVVSYLLSLAEMRELTVASAPCIESSALPLPLSA